MTKRGCPLPVGDERGRPIKTLWTESHGERRTTRKTRPRFGRRAVVKDDSLWLTVLSVNGSKSFRRKRTARRRRTGRVHVHPRENKGARCVPSMRPGSRFLVHVSAIIVDL